MPTQQVGSSSSVVIPSRPVKLGAQLLQPKPTRGGGGGRGGWLGEGCLRSGEQTAAAAKFKHHQRNVSGSQRSFQAGVWCRFAQAYPIARGLPLTFLHGGGGLPHLIF